jgi:hypothetical protein
VEKLTRTEDRSMAKKASHDMQLTEGETVPVGIIISQGSRAEDLPRFTAYIWAPAPTDAGDASATLAA